MTRLSWDAIGSRFYQTGLDRGVLYPNSGTGVAWNGLISVSQKPVGGDPEAYYMDGYKFFNYPPPEEYSASINAFTYPDEFMVCDGSLIDLNGIGYDHQDRAPFDLSYRTLIGNDVEGDRYSYLIHLVYNAIASPSDRSFETLTDDPEAMTFSWDVTTTPEHPPGMRPTAHLFIDPKKVRPEALAGFEDIIYGSSTLAPRLPKPEEVAILFSPSVGFEIEPKSNGLAKLDYLGDVEDVQGDRYSGLYKDGSESRLVPTSTPGVYSLE